MATTVDRALDIEKLWAIAYKHIETQNIDGTYGYLVSVFADASGLFVIKAAGAKLFKATIAVDANDNVTLGEWAEVQTEFVEKTQMLTVQRVGNDTRWFAICSTAVLNREAEIDSRQLYDSFINRIDRTGEYPFVTVMHVGDKLNVGKADWVYRSEYCYLASGTLNVNDKNPLIADLASGVYRELSESPDYWGISIGYIPLEVTEESVARGINVPVYTNGINVEISVVPKHLAASHFTGVFRTSNGGDMSDSKTLQDALERLLGDKDKAKAAMELVAQTNRAITDAKLVARTTSTDDGNKDSAASAQAAAPLSDEAIAMITRQVSTTLTDNLAATIASQVGAVVSEAVEPLKKRIAELEDAAKQADMQPRGGKVLRTSDGDSQEPAASIEERVSSALAKLKKGG